MKNIKFRAFIKRLNITVPVISIDFGCGYITWDDGQFDRCDPPNKEYEIEGFEDIQLQQYIETRYYGWAGAKEEFWEDVAIEVAEVDK